MQFAPGMKKANPEAAFKVLIVTHRRLPGRGEPPAWQQPGPAQRGDQTGRDLRRRANFTAVGDDHPFPGLPQPPRQRATRQPRPDDESVNLLSHGAILAFPAGLMPGRNPKSEKPRRPADRLPMTGKTSIQPKNFGQ